jgi:hypothetical protein
MKKHNMESRLLSEFKKGSKWYMVEGGQFDEFSPRIVNVVIGDTVEEDAVKRTLKLQVLDEKGGLVGKIRFQDKEDNGEYSTSDFPLCSINPGNLPGRFRRYYDFNLFSTIEPALEEVEKRITDIKEKLSKVRNRMLELGTEETRLEELLCTRILVTDKGNYCTYQDAKTGKRINLSSGCYYKVGTILYLYDGFKLNKVL